MRWLNRGRPTARSQPSSLDSRGTVSFIQLRPSLARCGPGPMLIDVDTFRIVARLNGHTGQVLSARWVSGPRVLTAGTDGTAKLWDGVTGRLLQTFSGGPGFSAMRCSCPAWS